MKINKCKYILDICVTRWSEWGLYRCYALFEKRQMNKLILIFCILTTNILFGQNPLDSERFNGDVKSVVQNEFVAKGENDNINKGESIDCSILKILFDKYRKIVKKEYCEMDILISYEYKFDSSRNIIERTNFSEHDRKYEYDNEGNLIQKLMFDSEGLMGYWAYKYDNKGNRVERTGYLSDDFVERWIMRYNDNGQLVTEYMVDEVPDTIPTYMVKTFEYDNEGRLMSLISTDPDTQVNAIDRFEYNDKNDLIKHYSKNNFQRGTKETITYKYTYDRNNNWTQRIEFMNGNPTKISERKIEYR